MYEVEDSVFSYTHKKGLSYYKSFIQNLKKTFQSKANDYSQFKAENLNSEQSIAYNLVKLHFDSFKKDSLKLIVHGVAGSGKSYFINCIKSLAGNSALVVAPTGVAALNINGQTIHEAFQFPYNIPFEDETDPSHEPTLSDIKKLDLEIETLVSQLTPDNPQSAENLETVVTRRGKLNDKLTEIKSRYEGKLAGVKLLIIDEFSMVTGFFSVGCRVFGFLNQRCKQIMNSSADFGGLSVILCGDLGQLPPVADFSLIGDHDGIRGFAKSGALLYQTFDTCVCFTTQVRQIDKTQEPFRNMLIRLRNGKPTDQDVLLLNTRFILNQPDSKDDFKNAIHLYTTNVEVDNYNRKKLLELNQPIKTFVSKESLPGIKKHHVLELCLGARVMLLKNLWTKHGLVNGSLGNIVDFVYDGDRNPSFIMVDFDNYSGPYPLENSKGVPISVDKFFIMELVNGKVMSWWRTRFPLRLAFACTIHKAQGLTLERAVIDVRGLAHKFSQQIFVLFFVAISRVKKIEDVLILHMIDKDLLSYKYSRAILIREREEARLNQLFRETCLLWS